MENYICTLMLWTYNELLLEKLVSHCSLNIRSDSPKGETKLKFIELLIVSSKMDDYFIIPGTVRTLLPVQLIKKILAKFIPSSFIA